MSRPLRILVAQNVPGTRTGGMSRMLGFIHDQVTRRGHIVEYFAAEDVPPRLNGRWGRFTFPLLLLRRVADAARAGRPFDVVNVHEPSSAAVALARGSVGRPRVVVTSHGVEQRGWEVSLEEARLGRASLPWKTRLVYPLTSLWQSRVGLRRADHVFCLSDEDGAYLRRHFRLPAPRVTRIYPAADPAYAAAFAGRDSGRADRLLFFGTWLPRKGTADLVEAFALLAQRHPRLELLVLGAGVPAAVVRASFPEPLRGRVVCPGPGTEAELAAHMASAAVLALPSLFEGTPQTLLEAMLAGVPPVATATCGMRDVIRDGHNGLLVPVRSPAAIVAAVDRLLGDRELRARLGTQAHADAAEHYTWERAAAPVCVVYERLAGEQS